MTEFEMRAASPADTDRILRFLTLAFGGRNVTSSPAYWNWKHVVNPFGASPVLLACAAGEIVGLRAFMRWTWRSGERDIAAVRAVDTATHPDWRGRGIFSKLTRRLVELMTDEGVGFVFNTPNEKSMPGYLKMGWQLVTRLPIWGTPGTVSSMLGRLGPGEVMPADLSELTPAADLLEEPGLSEWLLRTESGDRRYHTVRTLAYLRWRYASIPGFDYRGTVERAGADGAVVIVRSRLRGAVREVSLSEVIVTPGARGVLCARRALRRIRAAVSCDYLATCAARGTPESHALLAAGFVPVPRVGPHFTARPLNAAPLDPTAWASWRCGVGDLELF